MTYHWRLSGVANKPSYGAVSKRYGDWAVRRRAAV